MPWPGLLPSPAGSVDKGPVLCSPLLLVPASKPSGSACCDWNGYGSSAATRLKDSPPVRSEERARPAELRLVRSDDQQQPSRRQDCHFADALYSTLLKNLIKGRGGGGQNDSLADGYSSPPSPAAQVSKYGNTTRLS